ncbi:MAG: DM13 domain-containing protein [Calothrix sp. MO_167.B12]|nr:DM13 domain-containing protein [Calothrix sp. MO_167.B12]
MKLPSFTAASLTALLIVDCSQTDISQQPDTQAPVATIVSKPASSNASGSGIFQDREHPTKGTVKVITENGQSYLEFAANFQTDNGPDLFVILHREQTLPIYSIKETDYTSIAPLKKTSGTQRYAIPEGVDLKQFQSVAIWCRQFNATFGYAPLSI